MRFNNLSWVSLGRREGGAAFHGILANKEGGSREVALQSFQDCVEGVLSNF